MSEKRSRVRWGVLGCVAAVVLFLGSGNREGGSAQNPSLENRPDLISIDSMKEFGDKERPPVTFLHDLHTQATEKQQKNCNSCHLDDDKGRLSPKFKRLKNENKKQVMDTYHEQCIGCHTQTAATGVKSGPLVCGECHSEKSRYTSSRQPVGMDKSLHYRHSMAQESRCETCHHEYNGKTKELFYLKGKEGTCRYCHRDETEENRISMRLASHQACIDCHRKVRAKNLEAGPDKCGGCHDFSSQKQVKKIDAVPRMNRSQPNVVLVKKAEPNPQGSGPQVVLKEINRVPFSHMAHEGYTDTCRVCHHASMESCASCHTTIGGKTGGYVSLSRAMHQVDSKTSCQGCHDVKKMDKKCAGCHAYIERAQNQDTGSCVKCHMNLPPGATGEEPSITVLLPGEVSEQQPHEEHPVASALLDSRIPVTDTYASEEIPEKVTIKVLEEKYQPVELPHGKIVATLLGGIRESKLTQSFHEDKGTLCQGCHHNSPPSKNPPKCGSCHGKPFLEKDLHKPGLMAAYHQQCMGCHYEMGLEKPVSTDCTACHKEKGNLNMGY